MQRPTIAQSVMEGKLPQTPPAGSSKPDMASVQGAPKADVNVSQPPATLPGEKTNSTLPGKEAHSTAVIATPQGPTPKTRREDPASTPAPPLATKPAASSLAPAQPPAVALAQAAAQPSRDTAEKVVKASLSEVTITSAPLERQAGVATMQTSPAAVVTPDAARHVAAQVALAVTSTPGKTTEIALNPEELGRVRLSLSAADGAIVLNVTAERPETQDLLRRHMDLLAQEFRQLGYTSISFSFGEQQGQARPEEPLMEETTGRNVQEEVSEIANIPPGPPTAGLDIRI
ncbi:flagellar hook-length control protein FliK [Yoonia sp. GPGPB17]|uniref:flagellar hook-length control protein FliK n=1 Tax=Yoonia sp. GPGPB17 TaxID=3026147 RepID=UPI0030C204C3